MLGCAAVPNGAAAGVPACARSHVFLRGCGSRSQGDRWTFSQASHARATSALSPRESSQTSFPPDSRHPTRPMECCSAVTRDAWRRTFIVSPATCAVTGGAWRVLYATLDAASARSAGANWPAACSCLRQRVRRLRTPVCVFLCAQ